MRAVIYTRVSSDPHGEGRSVESQESECRAVCSRNGWDIAEVLVDNDRGASRYSTKSRPEYKRLAKVLASDDVQVLVTWEASRAQRDLSAYLTLRDLCAERGVLWSYSGRVHDLTKGDDRFTTGLDALLAEREAEVTRDRVLRGKRSAALKGLPGSRPPLGYRRDIDTATGKTIGWTFDEEWEPIIREIFDRVLAGESLWSVTRDFTQRGVETPKLQKNARDTWHPQSLRVTISSPTYAGWRTHQGKPVVDDDGNRVKGAWKPYITDAQHERLMALFSDPARRTTTHRGREPRHLLTGIAVCSICGSGMRFSDAPSHRARASRYLCSGRTCVGRRVDGVDLLVEETLLKRMERKDAVKLFATAKDSKVKEALNDADTLRKRLAGFVDQAADGKISPASLASIESKLLPQIEAAENKTRGSITSPLVAKLAGPGARDRWANFTMIEKRTVIRSLLNVVIKPSEHGSTRRFDPLDIDVSWKTSTA